MGPEEMPSEALVPQVVVVVWGGDYEGHQV